MNEKQKEDNSFWKSIPGTITKLTGLVVAEIDFSKLSRSFKISDIRLLLPDPDGPDITNRLAFFVIYIINF